MLQQTLPANTANANTLLQKQDLTAAKAINCGSCSLTTDRCTCERQGLGTFQDQAFLQKQQLHGMSGSHQQQFVQPGMGHTHISATDTNYQTGFSHGQGMLNQNLTCGSCNLGAEKCLCTNKTFTSTTTTSHMAPIVNKVQEETIVVKHVEKPEILRENLGVQVKEHVMAPIVQTHVEAAIIKEQHQNVIHEHHKDVIVEKHRQIVHEHHQPIIHEIHQPIIHQKHIHEIHQPIIHKKEQEIIVEQDKKLIHESEKHLVQEKVNADVRHEHFEKAISTKVEVAQPIIQHTQKETVVINEGSSHSSGHTHLESSGHTHTSGLQQNFQGSGLHGQQHLHGTSGLNDQFDKKVVIKETTTSHNAGFDSGLHQTGMHSTGMHATGLPVGTTTTTTVHQDNLVRRSSSSSFSSDEGELDVNGQPIQKKRSLGQKIKGMFSSKHKKNQRAEENYY